jgi:hypothetical protein
MGGCYKLGSGSGIQQISTLALLAFGAVRIRVSLIERSRRNSAAQG